LQNLHDPLTLLVNPINNSTCRQFLAKACYPMVAYFLVRESVPFAHALLAAMAHNDVPELAVWVADSAEPNCCVLSDEEFERARSYEGAIVLSSQFQKGKEIAIVFGPREEWPKEFSQFRDYFAEVDRREAERKHITEEIWLGCDTRPTGLANFALPRLIARKTRLFTIACCDLVIDKMVDPRSRSAIEVALKYANGVANDHELNAAFQAAYEAMISIIVKGSRDHGVPDQASPEYAAAVLASCAANNFAPTTPAETPDSSHGDFVSYVARAAIDDPYMSAKVTALLRDICGNPFHRVLPEPAWQSPGPQSLAAAIYDHNAFDRLAELASALENVGCCEQTVLDHCRIPGRHVRGCWVIDLVLGHLTWRDRPTDL
jgi:hypothetical protein